MDRVTVDLLDDDYVLNRLFWVLHVASAKLGVPMLSAAEVSRVLRDVYGVMIPWQRVDALLVKEKGNAVAQRRKKGRRAFQIMQAGVHDLVAAAQTAIFIDPGQALTKIRQVESILAELNGVVRVCDPYIDGRTLDFLAECSSATEVRLLTATIQKPNPFKRDLAAFRQQHHVTLGVREVGGGLLHDRYVIHDDGMILFGTSLNSIGRKQSFIVALGEDLRASVTPAFDGHWGNATPV